MSAPEKPDLDELESMDSVEGIQDPEEYYQRRRLKEIGDARHKARLAKQEMKEYELIEANVTRLGLLEFYRSAVEGYLIEAEPLVLNQYADEGGLELWRNELLGEHAFRPDNVRNVKGEIEPRTVEFRGLQSILDISSPIVLSFEADKQHPFEGHTTETHTEEFAIPEHILDKAVRRLNLFLSDVGMDVDIDENPHGAI